MNQLFNHSHLDHLSKPLYRIHPGTSDDPIRIVFFSGGRGSYEALYQIVKRYGKANLLVLFADTMIEDEDLYRFMLDTSRALNVHVNRIADGRTPIEVFFDVRFFGNSRIDPCSKILKRDLIKTFVKNHFPANKGKQIILYFGIGPSEKRRNERIQAAWEAEGYEVEFPLQYEDAPSEDEYIPHMLEVGIKPPRLYEYGFPHNNCGGACVKAGQKQWLLLLQQFPDRYAMWEKAEQDFSVMMGKEYTILRKTIAGVRYPLSLYNLRKESYKAIVETIKLYEWDTVCSCMGVEE